MNGRVCNIGAALGQSIPTENESVSRNFGDIQSVARFVFMIRNLSFGIVIP